VVPAGEPGHGDDIADHGGGDDWAGAEDLGDAGAGCLDRGGQLLLDLAPQGVQVADVGQQLGGEFPAGLGGRVRRRDLAEEPGCVACGDLVRDPAGHQVAEHGVQPAGGLVADPGKITMPLRPDLQHRGVIVGEHWALSLGAQCRHRDGQGIVGVALASVLGVQQPHPGGQLGLHIHHPLPRRQPAAGPAGGPARGRPPPPRSGPARRPPRRPATPPGPGRRGPAPCPAAPRPRSLRPRCASPCAGPVPIITVISELPPHQATGQTAAGMPYTGPALGVRPLLQATPRQGPTGQAHRSEARRMAGRRFGSQPHRTSPDATSTAAPSRAVSIKRLGARLFGPYRAVAVPTIMVVHRKIASVACIFIRATPNQQHSHMPR
jgi:hypothetical protein